MSGCGTSRQPYRLRQYVRPGTVRTSIGVERAAWTTVCTIVPL